MRRNSAGPEQFGSAPLHQSSSDVDLRALPSADSAAQLPSMSSPLPGGSAAGDDSSAFSVPLSSAASQQLAYARMLDDLPNKAEWSSLAHRGSIDPMQSEAANGTQPARPLFRKTGIICTIGPGTNSPSALADLRRAGMNIMRMNFSHGDHAYHQSAIDNLRKSFDVFPGPPVAIALDTKVAAQPHTTAHAALSLLEHSTHPPLCVLRVVVVVVVVGRAPRFAPAPCAWARWS